MKGLIRLLAIWVGVVVLFPGVSFSETHTEKGYLAGTGDSYSFTVTGSGGQVDLCFSYPGGTTDFWVSVVAADGTVSRYDLSKKNVISLMGKGVFTVTIYSRNGAGNWTARYNPSPLLGSPTDIEETPTTPSDPVISGPKPDPGEVSVSGTISSPGDTHVFRIPAESTYVEVAFYYQKTAMSLSVRVVGNDRRTVLGDYDLAKGEIIELYGGGNFYLTVYSTSGSGRFVARFNPKGSPIPSSYIIASGNLTGKNDKKEFPFEAKTDGIGIYFECPVKEVDVWVKVVRETDGTLLGDFDLKNEKIVNLNKKGRYVITVYSRNGAGSFTAFYFGGPPSGTVVLGTTPPEGDTPPVPLAPKFPPFLDESKLPPGVSLEKGMLDATGAFKTFIVNAKTDYVEVTFSYPKGTADFWVKVIADDGIEVLGDFDLDKGEIIQLVGGGTFYLKIYSKNGSGNWSAMFNEGNTSPYREPNGISNRPRYTF